MNVQNCKYMVGRTSSSIWGLSQILGFHGHLMLITIYSKACS